MFIKKLVDKNYYVNNGYAIIDTDLKHNKDFNNLIKDLNFNIDRKFGINKQKMLSFPYNLISLNLFASHAVFLVSKNTK